MSNLAPIPVDSQLPALTTALSATRMLAEFDTHLLTDAGNGSHNSRYKIDACRIDRVRYKPGQKCVVCYRLDIRDLSLGTRSQQYVSARIFPPGISENRYHKALREPLVTPRVGAPVFHIDYLGLVAWNFPNERKLTGLPLLADRNWLAESLLPELVRNRFGADTCIVDLQHTIQRYVPEHSCTVRVELLLDSDSNSQQQHWTLFGKTYFDNGGQRAFRVMRQLSLGREARCRELCLPDAVAYNHASRSLWQEGLRGATLTKSFPRDNIPPVMLDKVAVAIAEFHALDAAHMPVIGAADVVAKIELAVDKLTQARPMLGERLHALRTRLAAGVPARTRSGTLHGDLHPQNVFITEERVALIDIDCACRGPVLLDLGSWIAGALYRALLHGRPVDRCLAEQERFVARYAAAAGRPVDKQHLNWFTAAMLVAERCARAMSRLKTGRAEMIDQLLDVADQLIADDARVLPRLESPK